MLHIDPSEIPLPDVYALMTGVIVPRPIAWVSSCSAAGVANLAPFSYFNGVSSRPPAIMFSAVNWPDGSEKDTTSNVRATGEFVVNIVPHRLARAMAGSAERLPAGVDEFLHVGLEKQPSVRVKPPRVAAAPVQLECRRLQIVTLGEGALAANVIFGEILLCHIDPTLLDAARQVDPAALDAVGRLGGNNYVTTRDRFTIDDLSLPESRS